MLRSFDLCNFITPFFIAIFQGFCYILLMMKHTKETILKLLETSDKAVCRALVALNARQTSFEQSMESTTDDNHVGFRPCDAKMGTSMSNFYSKRGYLTDKQIAYWRKPNSKGKIRIGCYAGQLLKIAEGKI